MSMLLSAALATTIATASVHATPEKAGTARRPAGVKLQGTVQLATPQDEARPIVTGFELWTGPGLVFNRRRSPVCPVTTLSKGGPAKCPPKSLVGSGQLLAGPPELSDLEMGKSISFFNAPGGTMAAWMVLRNPARVQAAVLGTVVDGGAGPWPHRDVFAIPSALQVVAGIPITLRGFTFAIGGKAWARTYLASTRCPAGGWAWKVRVHLLQATEAATVGADGRTPCHR